MEIGADDYSGATVVDSHHIPICLSPTQFRLGTCNVDSIIKDQGYYRAQLRGSKRKKRRVPRFSFFAPCATLRHLTPTEYALPMTAYPLQSAKVFRSDARRGRVAEGGVYLGKQAWFVRLQIACERQVIGGMVGSKDDPIGMDVGQQMTTLSQYFHGGQHSPGGVGKQVRVAGVASS
jgi:hypothetical protein